MAEPVREADVLSLIEEIVRREMPDAPAVTPEADLFTGLALDSFVLLTLAIELEDRFQVALREEDTAGLHTVGELARLVVLRSTEAA